VLRQDTFHAPSKRSRGRIVTALSLNLLARCFVGPFRRDRGCAVPGPTPLPCLVGLGSGVALCKVSRAVMSGSISSGRGLGTAAASTGLPPRPTGSEPRAGSTSGHSSPRGSGRRSER
jgi:hypothetical protein